LTFDEFRWNQATVMHCLGFSQPCRQASRLAITSAAYSNAMFVCAHDHVAILINGYLKNSRAASFQSDYCLFTMVQSAESTQILEEMFEFNILKRKFQRVTFLV
jgi:hypothetical protein